MWLVRRLMRFQYIILLILVCLITGLSASDAQLSPDQRILCPAIYYYHDRERIWYLGDHLILGTLLTRSPYNGKTRAEIGKLADVLPVDFSSGCAMLVHRSVFNNVGLFDSSLVMYGEEIDFCWRARLAGFRIACVTGASVWHKVSLSARKAAPQTRYLQIRNQILFYRKYAGLVQKVFLLPLTVFGILIRMIGDIFGKNYDLLAPSYKGWIAGWWGQYS